MMFPKHAPIQLNAKGMRLLRLAVFERDGCRCTGDVDGERCNRPVSWDSGHLHHVKSRGKGGDDSLQNCVTLCWKCHAKEHVRPLLRWIRETA